MISTVTSTTVAAVSSVALAASLALLAVVTLLVLLMQKEILTAATSELARTFSRVLNVAVIPLLLCFALIAVVKVAEVLN